MDTDFSQDSVLRFLQSRGGSVKNADLLLHFKGFLRDHADQVRNRELFKKFVNSVATVNPPGGWYPAHQQQQQRRNEFEPDAGTEASSSSRTPKSAERRPTRVDVGSVVLLLRVPDVYFCHQSLVPLEPREHAWLVKGASGAWPDIYSLFREDCTLLNRRDFISGFTVLHWIAKHGSSTTATLAGLAFDINARSSCGQTPLHIAAIHGNKNMIRLLVNKFDADVKLRDTAGKKPWQYLSRSAPQDVFHLLAAPTRRDGGGETGSPAGEGGDQQKPHHRRRQRRHRLSFAPQDHRPRTVSGTKVKRSSSIAAFLKHKSLARFHGYKSDD
uniref:SOWAHA-C winged helix-turn-helix domain-containing protein n=1 Tax=Hippocampus comes TaxID=109280 RepID=A0A3Q3E3V1_HIPCM